MTCSSAAQIVTIYDQYGVPVKIQTISDSFVQNGTMIQSKPNIIAPATRTELHVTNPDLHDRQQIIRYTWQTTSLTLSQGDIRLFTWKGQSEAVTGCCTHWEFDCVSLQTRTKAHQKIFTDISLCSLLRKQSLFCKVDWCRIFLVPMSLTFDASMDTRIYGALIKNFAAERWKLHLR